MIGAGRAGVGRRAGAAGGRSRRPGGRGHIVRTGSTARGGPGGPRRPRHPLGVAFRTALSRRRRLIAAVLLSVAAAIAVLQLSPSRQATVPVVVAARSLGAGTVLSHDDLQVADYPESLVPGAAARQDPADTTGPADSVDPADPAGPADPSDPAAVWVGRTLSASVVQGQPLTAASVLGPDLLAGQPPGTTAVTIRVADPGTLTHLRPGQRVDLIRRDDGSLEDRSPDDDRSVAEDTATGDTAVGDTASADAAGEESATGGTAVADDGGAAGRAGAGLPVLWVADPVEPSGGLLEPAGGVEDDLLVVAADQRTAARIAASGEGELVPVLVAAADAAVRP